MEAFRETHPNYTTYASEHFHVTEVPDGVVDGLHGLLAAHCRATDSLKSAANVVLSCLPEPPTQNWGHDWIVNDLDEAVRKLSKKPLHKIVDCMGVLREHLSHTTFPADLEEL